MQNDLIDFFSSPLGRLVACAIIIAAAALVDWVLRVVIRRTVGRIVNRVKKSQNIEDTALLEMVPISSVRVVQRTRTLGTVLVNVANVFITVIALVLCVNLLSPGLLGSFALLTAAVGAGLGFGAQNIVKDVLNGMLIVIEDQLGVGDVIDTGLATGVVESVGIRVTQVRDVDGTLWYVRNGEMLRIGNMSQGWARAIVDIPLPYDSDVDAVQTKLVEVAKKLAGEPKWRAKFTEKPEGWGIQSISAEALVLRIVAKTRTTAKDDVLRELRKRLKAALDELGVHLAPSAPDVGGA